MNKLNLRTLIAFLLLATMLVIPAFALAQEATAEPAGGAGETTSEAAQGEGEEEAHSEEGGAAAAEPGPLTPLGINMGFLLAQIFNFVVVAVLLTLFVWGPLMNTLDNRAATVAKGLEDAQAAAQARANAEAEAQAVLQRARSEIQASVEQGRQRGEEVAKQLENDARTQAEKILADARDRATTERNAELSGLRGQVAAISIAVAERLLRENLDNNKQGKLVDQFFTSLPASARNLSGTPEVISAMPLNADEQNRVKKELGVSDATFTVDPGILGGLVIRAGDRVIDGSVRSGLSDLAERLN